MEEEEPQSINVNIPIGSSTAQIGQILEDEGLVRNGTIFRYYVRYKNESGFQAGDYQLSTGMDFDQLIDELKDGMLLEEAEIVFTVPEGRWLEDAATIISNETAHEQEAIIELISDEDFLKQAIDQYSMLTEEILKEGIRFPLEGYLFPARYDFVDADPSIEVIVNSMLERTQAVLDEFSSELEESEHSIHEIMTLASIIEREARTSEDRYLISGVLYNRLSRNMPLQVDPTVAYALGEHRYMTTYEDLKVDSPYNTYMHEGLPVGPIANPGKDAIQAAIQPQETDYLYFYARYNGEVIYSNTYEEHNAIHQQYRQEWIDAAEKEGEVEQE